MAKLFSTLNVFSMRILLIYFLITISSFFASSCDFLDKSSTLPETLPEATDELIVIVVDSYDSFYQNSRGEYAGLDFDLVSEFARETGKNIKFIVVSDVKAALLSLENNQGHLAVGINIASKTQRHISFGPVYKRVQPQVAYNTNFSKPEKIRDIARKNIEIVSGTVHADRLNEVKLKVPGLSWTEMNTSAGNLLARLSEGKNDYVIADSIQIGIHNNYYTNLGIAMNFGQVSSKAWAFSSYFEPELKKKAKKYFKRIREDGTLNRLLDRYYGHIERLGKDDVTEFYIQSHISLPDLRGYFYEAEEITNIDWRLIAALAYQESHWDPTATSPTNVRGIMMLTEDTAERMKVTDRLDARQSILAGARYLSILKDTLPSRIVEPDRTWIALAAYNQGYGHIEDARILAQRMKLSPDFWVDLKKSLPLLSYREYFEKSKHGYAQGGQAVFLAESVRAYYDILKKNEAPYK
jgi:membrane-bound lytic murein transglycosylase F